MNIDILVANLERTIAGKEQLAATVRNATLRSMVQINIDELKRILVDARVVQQQVASIANLVDKL